MKILLSVIAIFFITGAIAQEDEVKDTGVEKSLFNVQAGFLGAWASHELGLSESIALHTEAGLYGGLSFGMYRGAQSAFFPGLTMEPRWYYNIEKRAGKGKNIEGNAANYLTLGISYYPDWFVISGTDNLYVPNQLHIVPKWAIRRNIGNSNFNYELGIGLGYIHYFEESISDENTVLDLRVRIGYRF